ARNCLGTRPDTGDLLVFRAGLLSELLSRRQAPHGAPQELVRRELITTTCGGGPEGIRTPDLLNAIQTRSQLRHGPMLSEIHDSPGAESSDRSFRPAPARRWRSHPRRFHQAPKASDRTFRTVMIYVMFNLCSSTSWSSA